MRTANRDRRSRCPINHAIEIIGDRWSMLVIRDMVFHQKQSFSELRDMPEGISTNILADRLARLEAADILSKIADPHDGRRFRYELTAHGRGLIPVLMNLMAWSREHCADVDVSKALAKQIREDPLAAVAEIEHRLDAHRRD